MWFDPKLRRNHLRVSEWMWECACTVQSPCVILAACLLAFICVCWYINFRNIITYDTNISMEWSGIYIGFTTTQAEKSIDVIHVKADNWYWRQNNKKSAQHVNSYGIGSTSYRWQNKDDVISIEIDSRLTFCCLQIGAICVQKSIYNKSNWQLKQLHESSCIARSMNWNAIFHDISLPLWAVVVCYFHANKIESRIRIHYISRIGALNPMKCRIWCTIGALTLTNLKPLLTYRFTLCTDQFRFAFLFPST